MVYLRFETFDIVFMSLKKIIQNVMITMIENEAYSPLT